MATVPGTSGSESFARSPVALAGSLRRVQLRRLQTAIKVAGPRYTPRLSVDVPISSVFDGLGRTPAFFARIRDIQGKVQRAYSHCEPRKNAAAVEAQYKVLAEAIGPVLAFFRVVLRIGDRDIAFEPLLDGIKKATNAIWDCDAELRRPERERSRAGAPGAGESYGEEFSSARHYLFKLRSALQGLGQLCESADARVANNPLLLVGGVAGTGKTHLFCDVAQRRLQTGLPTWIFLGEEFTDADPWSVISRLMGVTLRPGRLLATLNQYGKRRRTRVVLMIDALNEAQVRVNWKSLLKVKRYRYVALAVSVRSGFEREVLSRRSLSVFIREAHRGFEFREWEAVTKFFRAFKIPLPEVPLLTPEFQNPLFLMLFCRGLEHRRGRPGKQAFRGHEGSTYIFEQFVKNAARKVAKEFSLAPGRDTKGRHVIWDTVVEQIAERMARQRGMGSRVSEEGVLAIVEAAHPTVDARRLVRSLERNLLLTKVPRYSRRGRPAGYEYRFPFQKFSDHLVVRYLLKHHLQDADQSFRPSAKLGKILTSGWNRGLIEALAVQVPERLNGKDLVSVAPTGFRQSGLGVETFLASLVWRAPHAFNVDEAIRYINEQVIKSEEGHRGLLNALLTVATIPEHPLNADQLHHHLWRFSMAARDAWWLPFLHYQYGENLGVDRLVAWAWDGGSKTHIADKPLELAGVALTWFLASSNRFLRDRATKALVALLTDRLEVVARLVERFDSVNDPYVSERLYAVAYGCVLRSTPSTSMGRLAQLVYDRVFRSGRPTPDIFLRDYARGVIETALHHGSRLNIGRSFRPPYRSRWPMKVLSEEALKAKYYEQHQACKYLWFSILGSGDFDRYVIQPYVGHFTKHRLGAPYVPSRKEEFEAFVGALKGGQIALWEKRRVRRLTSLVLRIRRDLDSKAEDEESDRRAHRQAQRDTAVFVKSLSAPQKLKFQRVVVPYEESGNRDEFGFDLRLAGRWIYQRVFSLGWRPKLFAEFDSAVVGQERGGPC